MYEDLRRVIATTTVSAIGEQEAMSRLRLELRLSISRKTRILTSFNRLTDMISPVFGLLRVGLTQTEIEMQTDAIATNRPGVDGGRLERKLTAEPRDAVAEPTEMPLVASPIP